MLWLDKNHDPRKNAELLVQISGKQLDLKQAVQEAEQSFQQLLQESFPPVIPSTTQGERTTRNLSEMLFRPFSEKSRLTAPTKILVDDMGNVTPDWKIQLDEEYLRLKKMITKEVNVADYGAVGDGVTDCTSAFKKAIGKGQVKVIVPPGVFITKGIQLPSWTWLAGSGKGQTTIKLSDDAPKGTRLITNSNHWKGNHHLFVQGMSLDWNVERLGDAAKTSTFGNHSSCLTYANVTYGWVKDVEGMNPGLHCFDISSTQYNYAGDGFRGARGSKYVWLDQLTGCGFGDDGITTHHSDYIYISNSHMCDPSGRAHEKGSSNSNGFEVDDGSRNVLLVNNSSTRCFGGVEIKAHQNSSAASNVQIVGHISVNDNRSFNFRHIGHHKGADTESHTAFNILAVNLASVAPVFTDLYKDSTPRGMVISAYKNVVVHYCTFLGDPEYDFKNNPIVAVQYRARKVHLCNFSFKNFKNASSNIKVYGGDNRADAVKINQVDSNDTGAKVIDWGSDLLNISVDKIHGNSAN